MKTRFFHPVILFLTILMVAMVSCNKEPKITEQYMRGGNSLVLAPDGNLVVAGYTSSNTKGYETLLIKANASNGDTLWTRKFGSSYSDAFYCIKNAHKGGFIAAGFSNRANASSPAMLVVITDANGITVKTKTMEDQPIRRLSVLSRLPTAGTWLPGIFKKQVLPTGISIF